MEIHDLIRVVTRRWWLLVAGTVLAIALSYVALRFLAPWPRYQAASTVLIGGSSELDWSALQLGRDLAPTYAEWTRRRPVLQGAIDALGLDMTFEELQGQVDVRSVRDTQLMEIAVTSGDPNRAAAIANEVARQLALQPLPLTGGIDETERSFQGNVGLLRRKIEAGEAELADLSGRLVNAQSDEDIATITTLMAKTQGDLDIWRKSLSELDAAYSDYLGNFIVLAEKAVPPSQPLKPFINVFVAGITGLVFAIGLAFLREQLDNTVKTNYDVEERLSLPVMGVVTPLAGSRSGRLRRLLRRQPATSYESVGVRSEHVPHPNSTYRRLVGGIMRKDAQPAEGTFLITSPTETKGLEETAVALAMAWAEMGHKTILVDASLNHPVLHTYLGLRNEAGLVNMLNGRKSDKGAVLYNPIGKDGLQVVTSGPVEDVSPRLLHRENFEVGLDELVDRADIVLLYGPPVLSGPESANLASQVDYVLLVLDVRKTRMDEAQEAVELLRAGNDTGVGGVLNRAD